ncbi:MAG: hypothetical protein H0X24_02675 [Ktedonobacterales bacterium]|nr:hypothetical protein [Ktedonobacterales bacterium]
MSKSQRRKASNMQLMPIEQQQELQQRLAHRRDVEEAVKLLMAALAELLNHDKKLLKGFAAKFHASGHRGQYLENPNDTARRRQLAAQVEARIKETPLNWMGAVELSYNLQRMMMMIDELDHIDRESETMQSILETYEGIGEIIRLRVYAEMGHWPEEFPVPRDRITGDENDDLFKLTDHQPTLFDGA